jgi:hypothetical protein
MLSCTILQEVQSMQEVQSIYIYKTLMIYDIFQWIMKHKMTF